MKEEEDDDDEPDTENDNEDIQISEQEASEKKINVEEIIKKLIRPFRKTLKKTIDGKFNRKHYHWVDSNVQSKTFEFF